MIIRGNENPFLRGKPPKEYVNAFISQFQSPFANMSEAERTIAIAKFAETHTAHFLTSLTRLREICRSYNFFQLLAHFSYYDQIALDGAKDSSAYNPVEQCAAELLQALILQVPEDELSLRLDSPPPPEVLLETNTLLREIPISFSMKRYGSPGGKGTRLLSEMIRSHTSMVRNEGFPSQIKRTMAELVAPLDSAFESKRGLKLTLLAEMVWQLADRIGTQINNDFQQRLRIFRQKASIALFLIFRSCIARTQNPPLAFVRAWKMRI